MPKNKSWFHRLRDYFVVTENKQQQGKRKKSSRRWAFRWMGTKRPPSLVAPTTSKEEPPRTSTSGLKIKRRCSNSTTAVTTMAPCCASDVVSTKQVVVNHDGHGVIAAAAADSPCSKNRIDEQENGGKLTHHLKKKNEVNRLPQLGSRGHQDHAAAATMIQTAFRGHLARKALKALKGLVRLQAIIRGRAVRRQAEATLKCLESIVNIQSQVCATRYQMAQTKKEINGDSATTGCYSKYEKVEGNSQRHRRDGSLLTEEESFAIGKITEAAMIRRERMKAAYLFNGRHSAEYDQDGKATQRLRTWVERYTSDYDHQLPQMEEIKRVDTIGGKPHRHHHHHNNQQLKPRNNQQQPPLCIHGPDTPALMQSRRLLLQKKHQRSSDPSLTIPTYMAATESAKAKARLTPSPGRRQLRRAQSDACSDGDYSPYKWRISPVSSINSERTWSGTSVTGKNPQLMRSQYHNAVDPGNSLRSSTGSSNSKDLGFDQFQTWALNWN